MAGNRGGDLVNAELFHRHSVSRERRDGLNYQTYGTLTIRVAVALVDGLEVEEGAQERGDHRPGNHAHDERDTQGGQAGGHDHGRDFHVKLDEAVRASEFDRDQGGEQGWRQPGAALDDGGRNVGKNWTGGPHHEGQAGETKDQPQR